jgi:hypothetical protein
LSDLKVSVSSLVLCRRYVRSLTVANTHTHEAHSNRRDLVSIAAELSCWNLCGSHCACDVMSCCMRLYSCNTKEQFIKEQFIKGRVLEQFANCIDNIWSGYIPVNNKVEAIPCVHFKVVIDSEPPYQQPQQSARKGQDEALPSITAFLRMSSRWEYLLCFIK